MKRWREVERELAHLAVVAELEASQAARAGCSVPCLRLIWRVAALRATGGRVGVADLSRAGFGAAPALRTLVAEARGGGWLLPASAGVLELSESGRALTRETLRAWARAVGQLRGFEAVGPWGRRP